MVRSLQRLIDSVRNLLKDYPDLHALDQATLQKLFESVEEVSFSVSMFPTLGVRFPPSPSVIFYLDLHHCSSCDLGIFILAGGSSIPPHNHPGMSVFQKVISGDISVKSFDWEAPGPTMLSDGKLHGRCQIHKAERLNTSSPVTYLSPYHKNIHSITAREPSVILDLLIPPYDDDHPCYYFDENRSELFQVAEPTEPKIIPIRIDLEKSI